MKRVWLIGAVLAITGFAMSCGDDGGGGSGEPSETRRRVAQALSDGIMFEDGTVELTDMPESTAQSLVIEQDDAPVDLEPGTATLLPFDIENPDEEDDPVVVARRGAHLDNLSIDPLNSFLVEK